MQLTRQSPAVKKGTSRSRYDRLGAYLYIAPAIAVLLVFVFYPLVKTVEISFYRWNLVSPVKHFVGLSNYSQLLSDPGFAALLMQSLAYVLIALVGNFLLPLGLALLTLQVKEHEGEAFQALLFLPTVIAVSIGSLVWLWFYLPQGGIFNTLLHDLGISGLSWLNNPHWALPAVALVANWKFLGFNYLIALAGFKAIPKELLEAAWVDGARGWALLRHVILPLFAPSALFLFLSTVVQSMGNAFVPIEVLTLGGPAGSSSNLMYSIFQNAFQFFRAGYASAESVVLILLFAGFILWQLQVLERGVTYGR